MGLLWKEQHEVSAAVRRPRSANICDDTLLVVLRGTGACPASANRRRFPPLEQWKAAVISGNVAALQALYSSNPPAQIATAAGASTVTSEVAFWTGLKARRMKLNVIQSESPQAGVQQVVFQAEVHTSAGPGGQTLYVTEGQLWQKQG